MENIQFDSGIREYRINGTGVLRFNPGDPNVYGRFLEAADKLCQLEQTLVRDAENLTDGDSGAGVVQLMVRADQQIKQLLSWVFGHENDFEQILGGVNLLAVADNGQRVVTNLLSALQPILVAGAQRCAQEKCEEAVRKANARRNAQ